MTLLDRAPRIDAVFLSGDVLATGALLEANRRGLGVPSRIAIVGSDDNELQESVSPPLTTLRFPRYQIGHRAAGLLMERLRDPAHGTCMVAAARREDRSWPKSATPIRADDALDQRSIRRGSRSVLLRWI